MSGNEKAAGPATASAAGMTGPQDPQLRLPAAATSPTHQAACLLV